MWVDDGSCKTKGDGNVVECVNEAKGDSKCNAMWKGDDPDGVTAGEHYWVFKVMSGSGTWVGITTEAKFGPGYKCKGAMYGGPGNTSDGGGLVQGQFGEDVKEGDELGVLLSVGSTPDRTLSVFFFHNGRPLGEAFRIAQPDPAPLFPVVGFKTSPEKVAITKCVPPEHRERALPKFEGLEGHFSLRSCVAADGKELTFPDVSIQVHAQGSGYSLSVKAGNVLGGMVSPTSEGGWKGGPVRSTMMMCEETAEVEQFLSAALQNLNKFEGTDNAITVEAPGTGTAVFERRDPPAPSPSSQDMLSP
mmetsp:Transcript_32047/g.90907  ORF Transcript_32047/g.90907 Transcript_32047/m.90907 type:complete len:304 (-) Transcript_32047:290-1201(-)|eukprot:CAMPEP_0117673342 /NCGR_PEP_ID=MMETSP0804-20121206/14419_1 /TAXON_ID=1074897 /ORGANISM="Tetraselmis astigmatica, Strain CCMP880" /LENGTH=303 /DNA_ID=CAMNT_0005482069 /DNA_START=320 /DNA_END=1231 /DNA_ORIENTATION=+